MATYSNNEKRENLRNLRPMHGSRIAQFPPMWKDISVLSRKKKSTRSYYSTKDREMGLTPTAIPHIIACCPKLSASMYLPIRHNEVAKVIYENLISCETKVPMKSIQEFYSNAD